MVRDRPGIGIQTRGGRLVIPANHALAGTKVHQSHLFYSDDRGKTWTLGGIAADHTNESQVVELADGRLMLNMRNHPPKKPENMRMVREARTAGARCARRRPMARSSSRRHRRAWCATRSRRRREQASEPAALRQSGRRSASA